MRGDGAEGTASETAAMDIDTVLDHVVGGDALALVFGVGLARIGQVEGGIEFRGGHRGIGRINDHVTAIYTLQQTGGMHHVRLLLDMAEVLGLRTFVLQTFFVAVEYDVLIGDATRDVLLTGEIDRLRDGFDSGSKFFTIHCSLFT